MASGGEAFDIDQNQREDVPESLNQAKSYSFDLIWLAIARWRPMCLLTNMRLQLCHWALCARQIGAVSRPEDLPQELLDSLEGLQPDAGTY